jgi:uncharacterized membrane protein YfcA
VDYFIIALAALLTSLLTFFSGFGLGTLLLPVFAIFFPVEYAIALTAIVHFLNNIFKLTLVGKHINWQVVLRFGIPAVLGALAGAYLLLQFDEIQPLHTYTLGGKTFEITVIKLIIAVLILVFTLMESAPRFNKVNLSSLPLWFGGILSGFFGGLSGHQGALRSAFLVKFYLPKEAFIATGVAIACMVDITRLSLYSSNIGIAVEGDTKYILLTAILAAFAGALIGNRLLKKTTMEGIKDIVTVLLILMSIALAAGLI